VVKQFWRLKLAVGFLAQVEDRQAGSQVLVIRRVTGDQVRSGLDDGFMDVGGFDAVIKLDVGTQFYLGNGDVLQPFRGPVNDTVDFIKIDAFFAAITFSNKQTLVHGVRTLKVYKRPAPHRAAQCAAANEV